MAQNGGFHSSFMMCSGKATFSGRFEATSTLVASSFEVQLQRETLGQPWGFQPGPEMRLQGILDGGLLARWNWRYPSQAALVGDQLVSVNGLSESKAVQQSLKQSLGINLALLRQSSMSTFGIKLLKTADKKLGFKLSEDVEVIRVDAQGALAAWNASNPLLEVHLGDRILQVGETLSREQIFRSLQSNRELDFLIGRSPRRLDVTGQVLSFKECEAVYGKEAESRWAGMQPVPEAPEQVRAASPERRYLAAAEGGENRSLLASESFYRMGGFLEASKMQHLRWRHYKVYRHRS